MISERATSDAGWRVVPELSTTAAPVWQGRQAPRWTRHGTGVQGAKPRAHGTGVPLYAHRALVEQALQGGFAQQQAVEVGSRDAQRGGGAGRVRSDARHGGRRADLDHHPLAGVGCW